MDKKRCGNTYRGILLSHKKEWDWITCRDMDRPRDCHTDWRKSERDKQISYINAYMWNLGKWYTWYYLQSKNRDTEVQNKHLDTRGERETGVNWETEINIYTWLILCITSIRGFPGGASGKGPTCQCRRCKRCPVLSLGWEDSLEDVMATRSSILAQSAQRSLVVYSPQGCKESDVTEAT